MYLHRSIPRALAAALAVALPSAAWAHAHLRSAVPMVDGTVTASPPEVAITFSAGIEPRFSSIEVQDAGGRRVDKQDAHLSPGNDRLFAVGLPDLPPGTYTVIWHATATDTHRTEGSFRFTIKP